MEGGVERGLTNYILRYIQSRKAEDERLGFGDRLYLNLLFSKVYTRKESKIYATYSQS